MPRPGSRRWTAGPRPGCSIRRRPRASARGRPGTRAEAGCGGRPGSRSDSAASCSRPGCSCSSPPTGTPSRPRSDSAWSSSRSPRFHLGGAYADRVPALALTLHACGTAALGGGIFLAGQIFHLQEHWPGGLMLWARGRVDRLGVAARLGAGRPCRAAHARRGSSANGPRPPTGGAARPRSRPGSSGLALAYFGAEPSPPVGRARCVAHSSGSAGSRSCRPRSTSW